jgi:hypothetical protein
MQNPDRLVHHLLDTLRCSLCDASFEADGVNILGHQDELWFLTVTCPSCHTQGLVAALVRGEAASAEETAAAAVPDEGIPAGDPITERDVDEMRAFLRDYRGGLAALLERP